MSSLSLHSWKITFRQILFLILSGLLLGGCQSSQPEQASLQSETESEASGQNVQQEESRILVACFSATGNTEEAAKVMAEKLGADYFEIEAEKPYTSEDLNYSDPDSRTSKENEDPSLIVEIADQVDNMDAYDTVLIGYPIWWGKAPLIMTTFMNSYDFSGKTLGAFCTSASSPFGSSDSVLREAAPEADWKEGSRFAPHASEEEIMAWAGQFVQGK